MRTGSHALSLLAVPLNVQVLQALHDESLPLGELRREVGYPPVTTMRSYLRRLVELKLIERSRESGFPGAVSYELVESGRDLLAAAEILRIWLRQAPDGQIELGSVASKSVIKALVDGWDAGIVRALAARSLSLTELDRVIGGVTYPALERRLTAMRQVGLIEPDPERNGRVVRCRVTPWLRHAVAPLTAAVGWERRCESDQGSAPGKIDVEAAFLLAAPLLDLPDPVDGSCRLAVEFRRGSELEFAGATVTLTEGRVCSCVSRIEGTPDAWVSGPVLEWFRWVRGRDGHRIEIGGETRIARAIERGFRAALIPGAAV